MTAFNSQTISLGAPFCPRQEQPQDYKHSKKNKPQRVDPLIRMSNLPEINNSNQFQNQTEIKPQIEAYPAFTNNPHGSLGLLEPHFPLTPVSNNFSPFPLNPNKNNIHFKSVNTMTLYQKKINYFRGDKGSLGNLEMGGNIREAIQKKESHKIKVKSMNCGRGIDVTEIQNTDQTFRNQINNSIKQNISRQQNSSNCFKNKILTQIKFEDEKVNINKNESHLLESGKKRLSSENVLDVLQKLKNNKQHSDLKINSQIKTSAKKTETKKEKSHDSIKKIIPQKPFKMTPKSKKNSLKNESEVINKKIKKIYQTSNQNKKLNQQKSIKNLQEMSKSGMNGTFSQIMTGSRMIDRTDEKRKHLLSFASKSSFINTEYKKERDSKIKNSVKKIDFQKRISKQPGKNEKESYIGWSIGRKNSNEGKSSNKKSQGNILKISDLKMPELPQSPKLDLISDSKLESKNNFYNAQNLDIDDNKTNFKNLNSKSNNSHKIETEKSILKKSQLKNLKSDLQENQKEIGSLVISTNHLLNSGFRKNDNLIYHPKNEKSSGIIYPDSSIYSKGAYQGINLSRRMKKKINKKSDSMKLSLEISNLSRQYGRRHVATNAKQKSQERISSQTDRPTIYNIKANRSNQNLRNFLRPKRNSKKFLTKSISISVHSGLSHLDPRHERIRPLRPERPRAIQTRSSKDKFNLNKMTGKINLKSKSSVENIWESRPTPAKKMKSRTSMEKFPDAKILESISHRHSLKLYESKIFNKDAVSMISKKGKDNDGIDQCNMATSGLEPCKDWEAISARASFIFRKGGYDEQDKNKTGQYGRRINKSSGKINHRSQVLSSNNNKNIKNASSVSISISPQSNQNKNEKLNQSSEDKISNQNKKNLKIETRHEMIFKDIELSGPELDSKMETFGQSFVNQNKPEVPKREKTPVMKEDWNESERTRPLLHDNSAWGVLEAKSSSRNIQQNNNTQFQKLSEAINYDAISSHNLKDLETPDFSKDLKDGETSDKIKNFSRITECINIPKNSNMKKETQQSDISKSSQSENKPNIFHSENIIQEDSEKINCQSHKSSKFDEKSAEKQLHKTEVWLSEIQNSQKKDGSKEVNVKISVLNMLGNEGEKPNPAFHGRLFQEIAQGVGSNKKTIEESQGNYHEKNESDVFIQLIEDFLLNEMLDHEIWVNIFQKIIQSSPDLNHEYSNKNLKSQSGKIDYIIKEKPDSKFENQVQSNLELNQDKKNDSFCKNQNLGDFNQKEQISKDTNLVQRIPKLDIGSLEASEIQKMKMEAHHLPGEETEKMLLSEKKLYALARQKDCHKNHSNYENEMINNCNEKKERKEIIISQISFERIKNETQNRNVINDDKVKNKLPKKEKIKAKESENEMLEMMKENKSHESYLLPKSTSDFFIESENFLETPLVIDVQEKNIEKDSHKNESNIENDSSHLKTRNNVKSLDEIGENSKNENILCLNKGVLVVPSENKNSTQKKDNKESNGQLNSVLTGFQFDSGERELLESENFEMKPSESKFGLEEKLKDNDKIKNEDSKLDNSHSTNINSQNKKIIEKSFKNTNKEQLTVPIQEKENERSPLIEIDTNNYPLKQENQIEKKTNTQNAVPEEEENEEVVYAIRTNIETIVEYSDLLLKIIQEDFFDEVLTRINHLKKKSELVKKSLLMESHNGGWELIHLLKMGIKPRNAAQIILDIGSIQTKDRKDEIWEEALGFLSLKSKRTDTNFQNVERSVSKNQNITTIIAHKSKKNSKKFSHFKESINSNPITHSKTNNISILTSDQNEKLSQKKTSSDDREKLYEKNRKIQNTPCTLKISKTEDLNSEHNPDYKTLEENLKKISKVKPYQENIENLPIENLEQKSSKKKYLDVPERSNRIPTSFSSPKSHATISNMDNFATINEDLDSRPISQVKGETSIGWGFPGNNIDKNNQNQNLLRLPNKALFRSKISESNKNRNPLSIQKDNLYQIENPFNSAEESSKIWLYPSKPYLALPKEVFLRLTEKILSSYADSNIQPNLFDIQKIFHRSIFDAFNESLSEYVFRLKICALIPAEIELLKKNQFEAEDLIFALNKAKFLLTEKASEMVGFLLNKEDSALDHLPHLVQQENIDLLQREKMTKMVLKDFFTEPSLSSPTIISQKEVLNEVAVISNDVFTFLIEDLLSEMVSPF